MRSFRLIRFVLKFVRRQDGATMIEYGLMVSLIALLCMGAVAMIGQSVSNFFNSVASAL